MIGPLNAAASILLPLASLSAPADGTAPTVDELIQYLGFEKDTKQSILSGEIVSTDQPELTKKELAAAVAMSLPIPVAKLIDFVLDRKILTADPTIITFKDLGADPKEKDFEGIVFSEQEADEVKILLNAEAGSDLNLDDSEIQILQAVRKKFPGRNAHKEAQCRRAVSEAYRKILYNRYRAYRDKGLKGVAPYKRGRRSVAEPAKEIRKVVDSAKLLAKSFPRFYEAFSKYPEGSQKNFVHTFSWRKQTVDKRPCFVLTHEMVYKTSDIALVTSRQFFVGHSYNSLQILVGCYPVGDSTMVFYVNHTSTDQVAGFASGLRHSIGRRMMIDEIVEYFKKVRASVKQSGG